MFKLLFISTGFHIIIPSKEFFYRLSHHYTIKRILSIFEKILSLKTLTSFYLLKILSLQIYYLLSITIIKIEFDSYYTSFSY